MKISKEDFDWAISEGLISQEQADALWTGLASRQPSTAETESPQGRFNFINVLYYAGALIVIGAMGWLMGLGWESFGGGGILFYAAIYAAIFFFVGHRLWFKKKLRVAGGLFFTMAVCMFPLAIYGLERYTGFWPQGDPGEYHNFYPYVRGSWILMELGTIAAALIVLKYIRFPFLTAPAAFAFWFLSMDVVPLFFGKNEFNWDERAWVSLALGLALLVLSFIIDRRTREDFAFWGYLFGLLAFCGGLESVLTNSEWWQAFTCLIYVFLIIASVLFERPVILVFGAIGVFAYLCHLAHGLFEYSLVFPFVLSAIGVCIIFVGIICQRNRRQIEKTIQSWVPEKIRACLPPNRSRDRELWRQ